MTKLQQEPPPTRAARARALLDSCAYLDPTRRAALVAVATTHLPRTELEDAVAAVGAIAEAMAAAARVLHDEQFDPTERWTLAESLHRQANTRALAAVDADGAR